MTRGALGTLLLHREDRVVHSAMALAAIALLFSLGHRQVEKQLVVASMIGVVLGGRVGSLIAIVAQTSFSWSLPGFRSSMRRAFVTLGVIVAVAEAAVLGTFGTTVGPPESPVLAGLCGYFAFALSGAAFVLPILLLIVPAGLFTVFYMAGPYLLSVMVAHSVVTSVVAIVGGVAATNLAFSRRAHRLNAHIGGSTTLRAMPRQAPPLSHLLRRRFQGTIPRIRVRTTPIGRSVLRGGLALDGVEQSLWGGVIGSVAIVLLLAFPRLLPGPMGVPGAFQIFWPLALLGFHTGGWWRSIRSVRQWLPWSRRQHCRVTLLLHAWNAVTFVGMPAAAAALYCAFRAPDMLGSSLRVGATLAVAFPALSWLGVGYPAMGAGLGGGRRLIAAGALSIVLALALNGAVRDLPVLMPLASTQLGVAAAAAAATWTAHWFALRWYFGTHDLVIPQRGLRF